tara:strand:- start:792 stop:1220 length:429 start_codon:yes stop_codon:yes gene_type:complete
MFSKSDSKRLRHEFWTSFGKSFPRDWILYNTKVKGLSFKFHFDTKTAYVALIIDMAPSLQDLYWERLISHKTILKKDFLPSVVFDAQLQVLDEKWVSAAYIKIDKKVSIHNKLTWKDSMEFLNNSMIAFEKFYNLYENTIKI